MFNSSSENVFEALEFIGKAKVPPSLGTIARANDLPLSTAFRIVSTLQNSGFIQLQQKGYVLGKMGEQLTQSLFSRFQIRSVSYPFLQQLALMTGETCCLSVPIGWFGVRIVVVRGMNEIVLSPRLGESLPLSENLASKAILALMQKEQKSAYFRWRERLIRKRPGKALLEELDVAANEGFIHEGGNSPSQKHSIAFPIALGGRAIGAVSIEGPVFEGKKESHVELAQWKDVIRKIETIVKQQPKNFKNPFEHLPSDSILLPY